MDLTLILKLIAGHYLADYPLQTLFMAETKSQVFINPHGFHVLTAHAFTHGLVAGLLSNNLNIALFIGTSHWLIDFTRSSIWLRKKLKMNSSKIETFSIHIDQALHIVMVFTAVYLLN